MHCRTLCIQVLIQEEHRNTAMWGVRLMLFDRSVVILILGLFLGNGSALYQDSAEPDTHIASVNVTVCKTGGSGRCRSYTEQATYGSSSSHRRVGGLLMHVTTDGCQTFDFPVDESPWIALIQRGSCRFTSKIANAKNHNASGVIIYGDDPAGAGFKMEHQNHPEVVAVSVPYNVGDKIISAMNHSTVFVMISFDRTIEGRKINTISVLFVSVSFIVLMVISLAWLVFYYVQRFRFLYARDKTEVRTYSR